MSGFNDAQTSDCRFWIKGRKKNVTGVVFGKKEHEQFTLDLDCETPSRKFVKSGHAGECWKQVMFGTLTTKNQ